MCKFEKQNCLEDSWHSLTLSLPIGLDMTCPGILPPPNLRLTLSFQFFLCLQCKPTASRPVTLSSREEPCRFMRTCIHENEGSECLVVPQLPLALCGDQPGHTECSCVNFTGVHKHMVHTLISIVCSLAYVVCIHAHRHTAVLYISSDV